MAGHLFENYVIIEILKRFTNRGINPPLYYLRTNNGLEVDLIIDTATLLRLEIKLAKTPSANMIAGLNRFRDVFAALNPGKGYVISLVNQSVPLSKTDTNLSLTDFLDIL